MYVHVCLHVELDLLVPRFEWEENLTMENCHATKFQRELRGMIVAVVEIQECASFFI